MKDSLRTLQYFSQNCASNVEKSGFQLKLNFCDVFYNLDAIYFLV